MSFSVDRVLLWVLPVGTTINCPAGTPMLGGPLLLLLFETFHVEGSIMHFTPVGIDSVPQKRKLAGLEVPAEVKYSILGTSRGHRDFILFFMLTAVYDFDSYDRISHR